MCYRLLAIPYPATKPVRGKTQMLVSHLWDTLHVRATHNIAIGHQGRALMVPTKHGDNYTVIMSTMNGKMTEQ